MITLASLICFLGFYACYLTSSKSVPLEFRFGKWLQKNPNVSNSIGLCLFAISCILLIWNLGVGAGILTFFILLMAVGSMIIILNPLKIIGFRGMVFIVVLFLFFETIKF